MLHAIWQTVKEEMSDLGDVESVTRVVVRLTVAALLGGILGFEREARGKSAGLRTHMLVSLGAAMFVFVPQQAGVKEEDISRVLQGLVAGVGFLGAGAIIHNSRHKGDENTESASKGEVKGLTTAAGIWLTAAIGMAAGMGREVTAVLSTVLALVVLAVVPKVIDIWPHRTKREEPVDGPKEERTTEEKGVTHGD